VLGILLILWGVIGIVMSTMMFGDIGIACIVGGITALLSGIGFLRVKRCFLRLDKIREDCQKQYHGKED